MNREDKLILWFDEITIPDVPLVGGKNASLGEMYQNLTKKGVTIPGGFAITATAYRFLIAEAGIEQAIRDALKGLDTHDMGNLQKRGEAVRSIIRHTDFPPKLTDEIIESYHTMESRYGKNVDVAVRSSATAEDLPDASFAGQQETFLNITGEKPLIDALPTGPSATATIRDLASSMCICPSPFRRWSAPIWPLPG
jgi:pyruvate,water dikinase